MTMVFSGWELGLPSDYDDDDGGDDDDGPSSLMVVVVVLSGWELGLPNSGGGLPQMTIFLSQNFPHWPFHIFSHFPLNNLRGSFFLPDVFFSS